MKKKLLFVRGFSLSNNTEYDEYKQIYAFFRMSEYSLEYFKYTTEERLDQVYERLVKTINRCDYSVLIGHSMGGALLTKYCRENDVSVYEKIILLMPFIRTNSFLNKALTWDFAREWRVPKAMLLPRSYIEGVDTNTLSFIISVIINETFAPIGIHQPFYAKQNLFLTDIEIIYFFQKNDNAHLIYSPTDSLVSFDESILSQIKNQHSAEGGHLGFSSKKYDNTFFDKLLSILRL
jgi:pimeloyl-ACP methyl ester carboxylesterase